MGTKYLPSLQAEEVMVRESLNPFWLYLIMLKQNSDSLGKIFVKTLERKRASLIQVPDAKAE